MDKLLYFQIKNSVIVIQSHINICLLIKSDNINIQELVLTSIMLSPV